MKLHIILMLFCLLCVVCNLSMLYTSCAKATTYMVFKNERDKDNWKKYHPKVVIIYENKNVIEVEK